MLYPIAIQSFPKYQACVPRHKFETLAIAQLASRINLRNIREMFLHKSTRLYRLGSTKLMRSNLSRISENKPYVKWSVQPKSRIKLCCCI